MYFEAADEGREKVRAAVEAVEREMSLVAPGGKVSRGGLQETWAGLVKLLAAEPAHQMRRCPHCDAVGMSAATRCHHCWKMLTPPPHDEARGAQQPGGVTEG
jgi:hypothetical protein